MSAVPLIGMGSDSSYLQHSSLAGASAVSYLSLPQPPAGLRVGCRLWTLWAWDLRPIACYGSPARSCQARAAPHCARNLGLWDPPRRGMLSASQNSSQQQEARLCAAERAIQKPCVLHCCKADGTFWTGPITWGIERWVTISVCGRLVASKGPPARLRPAHLTSHHHRLPEHRPLHLRFRCLHLRPGLLLPGPPAGCAGKRL